MWVKLSEKKKCVERPEEKREEKGAEGEKEEEGPGTERLVRCGHLWHGQKRISTRSHHSICWYRLSVPVPDLPVTWLSHHKATPAPLFSLLSPPKGSAALTLSSLLCREFAFFLLASAHRLATLSSTAFRPYSLISLKAKPFRKNCQYLFFSSSSPVPSWTHSHGDFTSIIPVANAFVRHEGPKSDFGRSVLSPYLTSSMTNPFSLKGFLPRFPGYLAPWFLSHLSGCSLSVSFACSSCSWIGVRGLDHKQAFLVAKVEIRWKTV